MTENNRILDDILSEFVPMDKVFPPVADWHSANTYATFGEEFKNAYYNDKSLFKDLRGKGKGTGLAIAYGGSEYTVSENLGISTAEADRIVRKFNAGLPVFTRFARNTIIKAKETFHVKDVFGRMRYLPNIIFKKTGDWQKDKIMRSVAKKSERLSINAPIQMSGATQVKLMTINVGKYIETNNLHATYGNGITKNFTKHVVSTGIVNESKAEAFLDSLEDGNIRVVFTDLNMEVVGYYNRLVQMTNTQVKKHFTLHI